jgi:uncharacterized protein (DUF1778 family)
MARPTRADQRSTRRLELRLTSDEHEELSDAAAELEQDRSAFVREAIAEALSDFRERRIFQRRQSQQPVEDERRRGDRRVVVSVQNATPTAD